MRNRLGFVRGTAAWAGQGGGFGDAGMCWTWLGPGFGSAELAVAEGRAGGSAAVLELPAAGSAARAAFLCASGLGSYLSRAFRANKEALCPESLPCGNWNRLSLPVNTAQCQDQFWSVLWGRAVRG